MVTSECFLNAVMVVVELVGSGCALVATVVVCMHMYMHTCM
jgi:hypothetical protein